MIDTLKKFILLQSIKIEFFINLLFTLNSTKK